MKESREAWLKLRYPLIDRRMRRGDCVEWMKAHDIPVPPKSACIGCPFTDNTRWRELKLESPVEFEAACRFDDAIRNARVSLRNPVYLHPSLKPLRDANLNEEQADMFTNGCVEGYCGV